jgi:hypothetical protein
LAGSATVEMVTFSSKFLSEHPIKIRAITANDVIFILYLFQVTMEASKIIDPRMAVGCLPNDHDNRDGTTDRVQRN